MKNLLPVQKDVFAAPTDDSLVESVHVEEVGSVLARHPVAEIPPESRVSRDYQLLQFLATGKRPELTWPGFTN